MQRLRLKVRVAPQHLPVLVAGDQRHLFDGEARLEQTARAFVAQVVEVEILDREVLTGAGEGRSRRLVVIGKDAVILVAADGALFSIRARASKPETASSGMRWSLPFFSLGSLRSRIVSILVRALRSSQVTRKISS